MNDPAHLGPFRPGQKIILLAEDDPMIRNIARFTLEAEGYAILTANDGEEALHLSRQFPGTIHLLLTDILMPRLDGLELCRRLREERPDIQTLVMSGTHRPGEKIRFLPKPFTPAALRRAVALVMAEAPHEIGYTSD